jgi:hypothetical protein
MPVIYAGIKTVPVMLPNPCGSKAVLCIRVGNPYSFFERRKENENKMCV